LPACLPSTSHPPPARPLSPAPAPACTQIRSTPAQIEDYFKSFLKKAPYGKINQEFIDDNGAIQLHSGIYTFNLTENGTTTQVPARFCYVYKKQAGGSWRILTHHSSGMPEKVLSRRRSALEASVDFKTLDLESPSGRRALLSQAEANATASRLFKEWLAAVGTGVPTIVAERYAKQGAVLLPTVSNVVSGALAGLHHCRVLLPVSEVLHRPVACPRVLCLQPGCGLPVYAAALLLALGSLRSMQAAQCCLTAKHAPAPCTSMTWVSPPACLPAPTCSPAPT
jgi:hypothetical protein